MPIRLFVSTVITGCLLAQIGVAFPDEKEDCHEPLTPILLWEAEETRCQVVDLKKPWELRNAPDPDDPRLKMAKLLDAPRPDFGTEGEVHLKGRPVLQLVIDPGGKVERIGLIRGEEGPLMAALVHSVTKWEFSPATFEGTPVCSTQIVSMSAHY